MLLLDTLRHAGPAAGDAIALTKQRKEITMEKDLVCGMDVDPETAPAKSEYKGKTYYFCAPGCKKEFDANPSKYVS